MSTKNQTIGDVVKAVFFDKSRTFRLLLYLGAGQTGDAINFVLYIYSLYFYTNPRTSSSSP